MQITRKQLNIFFIIDVLFIHFETSKMQKLCGKRTKCFEVTTSSSAASNKICIHYNMKVLNFHIITNTNLILLELVVRLVHKYGLGEKNVRCP